MVGWQEGQPAACREVQGQRCPRELKARDFCHREAHP